MSLEGMGITPISVFPLQGGREKREGGFEARPYEEGSALTPSTGSGQAPTLSQDGRGVRWEGDPAHPYPAIGPCFRRGDETQNAAASARPFDRLGMSGGWDFTPISIFPHQGGRGKREGGFETRPYEGGSTLTPTLSQDGRRGRWGGDPAQPYPAIGPCFRKGDETQNAASARPFDRLRVSGGWDFTPSPSSPGRGGRGGMPPGPSLPAVGPCFRRGDETQNAAASARPFDRLRVSGGWDFTPISIFPRQGGRGKREGGFQTRPYEGGSTLTPTLSQDGRGGRGEGG